MWKRFFTRKALAPYEDHVSRILGTLSDAELHEAGLALDRLNALMEDTRRKRDWWAGLQKGKTS